MNPIDPESLIYRFAKQLEFGSATMQVASEAVRIVSRMNRDWMTTGRRPAGVCGAALILAARMNNFRRTVREVVYVVKVTEITISQRLNEFSSTESGELTVDQFRSVQLENAHDPPAFTRAREGRKPGRRVKHLAAETAAEIEDGAETTEPNPPQERRVDADGFAIPSLPVDPALTIAGSERRRSVLSAVNEVASEIGEESAQSNTGQPKGKPRTEPYKPSAEQAASEDALEDEMEAFLAKGSNMVELAAQPPPTEGRKAVSESAEIDASEFETDPEVANCLLAPAEVEIKERIWVHENKDYLRTQQAKALKRALAEADFGPGTHKPRKRRRGRLGDVTYLEGDGEEGDGSRSTRASTPAEATRRMLERRGFSKKINYRLLESLYGEEGGESKARGDTSRSRSQSQSRSHSVASGRSVSVEPEATTPSRRSRLTPSVTARAAATKSPAPAGGPSRPAPTPALPAKEQQNTNEEVLGPVPDTKDNNQNEDGEGEGDEGADEDDDYDDDGDGGEGDEGDGVDAAFAGNYGDYYDDESDGYDSD